MVNNMESSAAISKDESKEKKEELRNLKNVKLENHYLNGPLNEADASH